jgi:hypothetical protein
MKNFRQKAVIGIILGVLLMISACQHEQNIIETPENDSSPGKPTAEPEITQSKTQKPAPTCTCTEEPTAVETSIPASGTISSDDIYWQAGFETGNLKEYEDAQGEFLRQSQYGSYEITTRNAKAGAFSAALTIDTSQLSQGRSAAAYLAYYDNPMEAYYSGWIFIPEEVEPQSWWNIWQWKSTYNGNSDDSLPMWSLDLGDNGGGSADTLEMSLVYRPDDDIGDVKVWYDDPQAVIPKGEWVHISTYYVKSTDSDGVVAVWINGEQVFFIENAHTALSDNTLYWSVNNYTDSISPSPTTIYFDELVISKIRIEPGIDIPRNEN